MEFRTVYQLEKSLSRMASQLGHNPSTIQYHLKMASVKTRTNRKLSERDVNRIMQEYDRNPTCETLERMAAEFDVTVQAVRYHVTKTRDDPLRDQESRSGGRRAGVVAGEPVWWQESRCGGRRAGVVAVEPEWWQ